MNPLYRTARNIKNAIPLLRRAHVFVQRLRASRGHAEDFEYGGRLAEESGRFRDVGEVHDLPPIFHYWSNTYLRPMFEEYGFSNPEQFFAQYLAESARNGGAECPVFLSLGAGNCDTEIRVARMMRDAGTTHFVIECLDLNPRMLDRGRASAEREGLSAHIAPVEGDFNRWRPARRYDGIMANQCLHHVVALEGLFDAIGTALSPKGYFIASDMIGRNGHQRWPEAQSEVRRFWKELPRAYRRNRQLDRYERSYRNWDCALQGFEGIRAQEILPLLIDRFDFRLFIGFANVIDVFVDRAFGYNFDADAEWDRSFIDRVHAFDEKSFQEGTLTPTHMLAVMSAEQVIQRQCSRGITPEASVRHPFDGARGGKNGRTGGRIRAREALT